MEMPKVILNIGDTVDFYKLIGKEKVEYSGIIEKVNIDRSTSRSKAIRELSYDIKEDGCNTISKNIHHSLVFETIICEECGCNLLDVGIEERVFRLIRYERESKTCKEEISYICEDPYECSNCGCELQSYYYDKLKKYLSI